MLGRRVFHSFLVALCVFCIANTSHAELAEFNNTQRHNLPNVRYNEFSQVTKPCAAGCEKYGNCNHESVGMRQTSFFMHNWLCGIPNQLSTAVGLQCIDCCMVAAFPGCSRSHNYHDMAFELLPALHVIFASGPYRHSILLALKCRVYVSARGEGQVGEHVALYWFSWAI